MMHKEFLSSQNVMNALLEKGEARFVGGSVRDFIIGKKFADIDIATKLLPDEVIALLEEAGIKAVAIGIKHGTIMAVDGNQKFEITTLRKDISCDGRHAEVEFGGDWKEDAARRDFSMNAIFMDIEGNFYDYFDGINDLKNGVVKFVGDSDIRIKEDYLRILRFFRFSANYAKGELSKADLESCANGAEGIKNLSGERIEAEMMKIFAAENAVLILEKMYECGLFENIFNSDKVFLFSDLGCIISELNEVNPLIRLAAFISENGELELLDNIAKRWKISNKNYQFLRSIIAPDFPVYEKISKAEIKQSIRKTGKNIFPSMAKICWVKGLSSNPNNKNAIDNSYKNMLEICDEWTIPKLPISGKDILDLGILEGKKIGNILKELEEKWEASDYKLNKSELIKLVKC